MMQIIINLLECLVWIILWYVMKLFILSVLFFTTTIYAEVWRLTSLEWPPYSSNDLKSKGSFVEKIKEILKTKNIDVVVEYYPWLRSQKLAKQDIYVGYFPAWPEEVKEGFVASDTVEISNIGAFIRKGSDISFSDIESLFKNGSIGMIETYVYPEKITKFVNKYKKNVCLVPDETALIRMLSKGRFDIALTDSAVIYYYASKLGINNIVTLKDKIDEIPLVVSFRDTEENRKKLIFFNKLLKQFEKKGTLKINKE